jgi:hypothetical protein
MASENKHPGRTRLGVGAVEGSNSRTGRIFSGGAGQLIIPRQGLMNLHAEAVSAAKRLSPRPKLAGILETNFNLDHLIGGG